MQNCWDLLRKELRVYGIELVNDQLCIVHIGPTPKKFSTSRLIEKIKKKAIKQQQVFSCLWREAVRLLSENCAPGNNISAVDDRLVDLFIFSLQDATKIIHSFEDLDGTCLKRIVESYLARDITTFNADQIKSFPDFKISIDWMLREINKLYYLLSLLRFASTGEVHVNAHEIKTAKTVSGPWSNLDLPMLERVWPWKDEDENLRGRMRDIRKQRRYRMGLEHYNGDGRVGEGFYWREQRNEPYSWYNRKDEEPYYERYALTRN